MRSCILLVGLILGCGGASTAVEGPPAAPAPVASMPPAQSASPEKPGPAEPTAPAAKPEAAPPKAKAASRYSVDGVSVTEVDAATIDKKLGALGLAIDIPGKSGTMVAGQWETFNFGTKKGGKRHAMVIIIRPAKQPELGVDPAVEKSESPQSKYEQYKPIGAAVLDEEAGVMIAVGLYKACAVADPKTCKGSVIETDAASAKKLFDSIFATK
jgi:hypothetical protein